jgi:hypothetical protein
MLSETFSSLSEPESIRPFKSSICGSIRKSIKILRFSSDLRRHLGSDRLEGVVQGLVLTLPSQTTTFGLLSTVFPT